MNEGHKKTPMLVFEESISFSGAAFHCFYHLGVAKFLQKYFDLSKVLFLGASAGTFPAFFLGADISIQEVCDKWIPKAYEEFSQKRTGLIFNFCEVIRRNCLENIPTDAYRIASGRVIMSLTRLTKYSSSNVRISKWSSNEELLDTAFASGHIPFLLNKEMFSHLENKTYIDGSITDNQPLINQETICVSPYAWSNLRKIMSLYPVLSLESNIALVERGYNDAHDHLQHWSRLERFRLLKL